MCADKRGEERIMTCLSTASALGDTDTDTATADQSITKYSPEICGPTYSGKMAMWDV